MKHQLSPIRMGCGLLVLILYVGGCTTASHTSVSEPRPINTPGVFSGLSKDIEALYLGWRKLESTYHDIKFLERGFLAAPDDRILGYVQKINLYIQDASVRIHSQWEALSVIHYIRPERLRDYLTLREKGLETAIDAVGYDERFIEIYSTSIKEPTVMTDIGKAQIQIDALKRLMIEIQDKIIPLGNIDNSLSL